MLTRSGSLIKPRPLLALDCGSQSTSRVLTSAAAREAAKLMAVVVLPTPPFWLATAITRPIKFTSDDEPLPCLGGTVFHVEHYFGPQCLRDLNICSTWNIMSRCVPRGTILGSFEFALG